MLSSPLRTDAGPARHSWRDMEWQPSTSEALDQWLAWLELQGKTIGTRRTYAALTRPLRRLDTPVGQVRESDCTAILLERLRASQNSAATTHAALKGFFAWCVDERRYLQTSPMLHVPAPKHYEPPRPPLSDRQMRDVLDACASDDERLAVRLLATGMRAHELVNLQWRDVDFAAGVALLRVTKGSRPRPVPLDAATIALLEQRPRTDRRVVPITTQTLRARLNKIAGRGRLRHLHPHLFRHTWASAFYRKTKDPFTLQVLGGWSSGQTMQRYIKTVQQEAAIEKARETNLSADFFGDDA